MVVLLGVVHSNGEANLLSVEAISWVWRHSKSRLAARLLLLRIANNADEYGRNSWHTVPSMARATLLSERQVTRASRQLQALGEVDVELNGGPHGANVYSLPLMGDNLSPPPVTSCHASGDKSDGAIRKERPRTSKTSPCSPPQAGDAPPLTKMSRRTANNLAVNA